MPTVSHFFGIDIIMRLNEHRPLVRIREVKTLDGFNVELTFADGIVKVVNLEKYLHGPAFEEIHRDPKIFRTVFVDPINETIMWHNGAEIDADVLRDDLTPAWMEREAARYS